MNNNMPNVEEHRFSEKPLVLDAKSTTNVGTAADSERVKAFAIDLEKVDPASFKPEEGI